MADAPQRGTKRKRYEPKEHHDLKEVRKAAKKAKAFETQKLVKRLKGLRAGKGDEGETHECEAQLEAIKSTDHEPIANTAMKTKIKKDRLLSEDSRVQAAVEKELSGNILEPVAPSPALAKVHSRLLSSKILATGVAAAVVDLKAILQPKSKIKDGDVEEPIKESTNAPKKIKKAEVTGEGQKGRAIESDGDVVDELQEDGTDWESGSVDEGEGGWESGSIHSAGAHQDESSSDDERDNSGSERSSAEKSPPSKKKASDTKATTTSTRSSQAESRFLPSLSVGFIRGDSDSDFSDTEANPSELRKNRRGQRARRAIWEKKYGHNANHSKKERQEMLAAGAKQDQRRGARGPPPKATSSQARRGKPESGTPRQHQQQADTGWGQRGVQSAGSSRPPTQAATAHPAAARRQKEEQPLHPSWEAKKKLKEKQAAGIVPAQGTKIKF
ncbi:hypothetical protein HWV62_45687 [Athelia sp. TMB]|nr:hypothetical protein HWV62_45687 [Athelia sp. TMB]